MSDNQSAIKIAHNDIEHNKTKHIDIKYYYIRDLINNNIITLTWVQSSQQVADIFTKSLSLQPFSLHKNKLISICSGNTSNDDNIRSS